MVELTVRTSTDLVEEKPPHHQTEPLLAGSVDISAKRDTVVRTRTRQVTCMNGRYQHRHAVGLVIAAFIILAVGCALAGLHFGGHFAADDEARDDDWCPGCEYREPQEYGDHDEHPQGHGGEGRGRGGGGGPDRDEGRNGGESGDERGSGGGDNQSEDDPHTDPRGDNTADSPKGHRGRFGPKGVFDVRPRPMHRLPLP